MDKCRVKISGFLLITFLYLGLLQTAAIAKNPSYRGEWKSFNPRVTIVLRAPTSGHPYLVKFSPNKEKEVIKGLAVSLPEYTRVFFCVDLVNTSLYTITINAEKTEIASERFKSLPVYEALTLIKGARKYSPKTPAQQDSYPLGDLERKVKKVAELNKELDVLLLKSENAKFYNGTAQEIKGEFGKIVKEAEKKTADILGLKLGTSHEICDDAEAVLKKIHRTYKDKSEKILPYVPKDLSDSSNDIVAVFDAVVEKLRIIETATWAKQDTQEHLLKNQLKYTCVFTPRANNTKLKTKKLEVTVNPKKGLSGIRFTAGSFMTSLRDDHYISRDNKIALGGQDRFSMPIGGLAHAVICGKDYSRFSGALAVSTGFALGTGVGNGTFAVNGQAALGVSLLFSGPGGEGDMFAVTFGGIAKPVKRLNGYWVGGPFPKEANTLTRTVYRGGGFLSLTTNLAFLPKILGLKEDSATSK